MRKSHLTHGGEETSVGDGWSNGGYGSSVACHSYLVRATWSIQIQVGISLHLLILTIDYRVATIFTLTFSQSASIIVKFTRTIIKNETIRNSYRSESKLFRIKGSTAFKNISFSTSEELTVLQLTNPLYSSPH